MTACIRTCFQSELGEPDPLWNARTEIEQLKAERDRLREAMEEIASDPTGVSLAQAEIALAALAPAAGKGD